LQEALVDEFEDIFHAEADAVGKEDCCFGVKVIWAKVSRWKAWLRGMVRASTLSTPAPTLGSILLVVKW
jgi:hypothetical protein